MSISNRGQKIEKMAGIGGRLLGIGEDLMGSAKSKANDLIDDHGTETMKLMRDYPSEIPGYIGSKGEKIVDDYGSELASGAAAGAAGAAGTAAMSGGEEKAADKTEEKEASVRERFGLDSDQSEPDHSGKSTNRFI